MEHKSAKGKNTNPSDDFTQINGIGPGIDRRLHDAGIRTYTQLAALTPEQLVSSLGNMIGLSANRISEQRWVDQATELAPDDPGNESPSDASRQYYAMYTIELLLNEDNSIRRTHLFHIQSKWEETWAGWDSQRIIDFIIKSGLLNTSLPARTVEAIPTAADTEKVVTKKQLSGEVHLRELHMTMLRTGHQGSILPRLEPFTIDLTADLARLVRPDDVEVEYTALCYAKALGNSSAEEISKVQGMLSPDDTCKVSIIFPGLPEAIYRIKVYLTLGLVTSQPELSACLDGGLLQIV